MSDENTPSPSRNIRHQVGKAVHLFSMIAPGDRIMIGLSGGKDSMLLSICLRELQRRSPVRFHLMTCFIDPTGGEMDPAPFEEFSANIGVPFVLIRHDTFKIIEGRGERNPCSLCANLRRGILASAARGRGCNAIALGHHLDDAVETAMMNLLMAGRFRSFEPAMTMSRSNVKVIRPLVLLRESAIEAEIRRLGLKTMAPPCPFGRVTQRTRVKGLIREIESEVPDVTGNILNALTSIPRPLGWGREG